jgi:hypothetical protein
MIGVGTKSWEMMIMSRAFRVVLVVLCGLGILSESTTLAKFGREKILIHLWELRKERDFGTIMDIKEITKFL